MNSELELHFKTIWFGRNISKVLDESCDRELNLSECLTKVDVPFRRLMFQASGSTMAQYRKDVNNVFAVYPKK